MPLRSIPRSRSYPALGAVLALGAPAGFLLISALVTGRVPTLAWALALQGRRRPQTSRTPRILEDRTQIGARGALRRSPVRCVDPLSLRDGIDFIAPRLPRGE